MSISNSIRKAGVFIGDDKTKAYPFSFKVFSASDVAVFVANTDGNESELVQNDDYSVTLNDEQETHPGGTVNLMEALKADYLLTITSAMPALQPLEFTNQGGFYPRNLNDALDRLTILCQQLEERVNRAMKSGVNAKSVPSLPLAKAGSVLRWSDDGEKLVNDAFDLNALHAEIASLRTSIAGIGGQGAAELQARLQRMENTINDHDSRLRKVRILALAGL